MLQDYQFDPQKSKIFKARRIIRLVPSGILYLITTFSFFLAIFMIVDKRLDLGIITGPSLSDPAFQKIIVGIFLFGAGSIMLDTFVQYLKKNIFPIKDKTNIAEYLTLETLEVYLKAQNDKSDLNIYDKMILHSLSSPMMKFVLSKFVITPEIIKEELLKRSNPTPVLSVTKTPEIEVKPEEMNEFFRYVLKNASISVGQTLIDVGDLIYSINFMQTHFREILFNYEVREEDLLEAISWYRREKNENDKSKRFWEYDNLIRHEGIGKTWSYASTQNLDKFVRRLTSAFRAKGRETKVIGKEKEIAEIESVLARANQNNCLIYGPPGIGKKTIIYGLAKAIEFGQSLPALSYKRVLLLDLNSVVTGVQDPTEIITRLKRIFFEAAYAGNIILVIDNFHNFIGGENKIGIGDISQIIHPYLQSPSLHIVALTTTQGLHQNLEKAPGVLEMFEKVQVKRPSFETVLQILERTSGKLSRRYKTVATLPSLRQIISQTDRLFPDKEQPEKSIDILEEAIAQTATAGKEYCSMNDVNLLLTQKTGVPTVAAEDKEKELLLKLEDVLHERVVNQEMAVNAIANSMRRARTGVSSQKRPIGSFLFLGPTGVGKTETAKTLAASYFGDETSMLRFDMSEFQDAAAINRFIGSSQDTDQQGQFTNTVRNNPYSLILLDEIEKANPKILDLFLQVLDEGHITDNLGRKISFLNTIIIATSNAGSDYIIEQIKKNPSAPINQEALVEYLLAQGLYRPEFINRFDGVIAFQPLTMEHQIAVARLMMGNLQKRILEEKEIQLVVSEDLITQVARLGYDPMLGARPMRRVIQNKIEGELAKKILSGEADRGGTVELTIDN